MSCTSPTRHAATNPTAHMPVRPAPPSPTAARAFTATSMLALARAAHSPRTSDASPPSDAATAASSASKSKAPRDALRHAAMAHVVPALLMHRDNAVIVHGTTSAVTDSAFTFPSSAKPAVRPIRGAWSPATKTSSAMTVIACARSWPRSRVPAMHPAERGGVPGAYAHFAGPSSASGDAQPCSP